MAKAQWKSDAVIAAIQELKRTGRPIYFSNIPPDLASLYTKACRQFGNWKRAVYAAKVNSYSRRRKENPRRSTKWTRRAIVAEIKRRKENGDTLNSASVGRTSVYRAAYDEFGGWRQAIEGAGLDYEKIRLQPWSVKNGMARKWTRESVLEEIKRRHQNGLSLVSSVVDKDNSALRFYARKFFGGWKTAVEQAGVQIVRTRRKKVNGVARGPKPMKERVRFPWTKERVVNTIRVLAAAEVTLRLGSIVKSHNNLYKRARKLFGTWEAAVRAAGFDYSTIRKRAGNHTPWTPQRVLERIRNLAERGVSLKLSYIAKGRYRFYVQAQRFFNTWPRAVQMAGLDYSQYEEHKKPYPVVWLRKRPWLVSIDEHMVSHDPDSDGRGPTLENFLFTEDVSQERSDTRQVFEKMLNKGVLPDNASMLLVRVLDGDDLEDEEYHSLADMIRAHPELVRYLETS